MGPDTRAARNVNGWQRQRYRAPHKRRAGDWRSARQALNSSPWRNAAGEPSRAPALYPYHERGGPGSNWPAVRSTPRARRSAAEDGYPARPPYQEADQLCRLVRHAASPTGARVEPQGRTEGSIFSRLESHYRSGSPWVAEGREGQLIKITGHHQERPALHPGRAVRAG